jgi:hypothetical protein
LNQPEKRSFIKLLTHKDGEINEDIVNALPFIKTHSAALLVHPVREVRSDKIDLEAKAAVIQCHYCSLSK